MAVFFSPLGRHADAWMELTTEITRDSLFRIYGWDSVLKSKVETKVKVTLFDPWWNAYTFGEYFATFRCLHAVAKTMFPPQVKNTQVWILGWMLICILNLTDPFQREFLKPNLIPICNHFSYLLKKVHSS